MKYWGILFAKALAAVILLTGLWKGLVRLFPEPTPFIGVAQPAFSHDLGWTVTVGVFFLVCSAVLSLIVIDQKYRCRVCGRRLRMPVETGSWSRMLQLGRPKLEYICTYGHGTLKVPEVHFSGTDESDWKEHEDMWKELFHMEDGKK